jgi:UDP-N-acetylmuramoylalanine--D-glutamate ligase
MIDLFPFAGFPVAVFGLGPEGLATARALMLSEAEVWAWDEDAGRREAAKEHDIPLRDLSTLDWREPVSLVIEHAIPHGEATAHPFVAAARAAGCEVIADSELLARTQRDAAYVAVVSRGLTEPALDMFAHVCQISGRETEAGGDGGRPLLDLHPLDLGGIYVMAMPPARADLTLSVTFDAAVFLDLGADPWPPFTSQEEALAASRWVFHRQTGPKGAVVNVTDPVGRQVHADLVSRGEQIVIPISGRSRVPNGVYVAGGILHDDIAGHAEAVTDLPLDSGEAGADQALLAASVYATAVILDIPRHAAMASIRSFFLE